MKFYKKVLSGIAVLFVGLFTFILASCGGDDGGNSVAAASAVSEASIKYTGTQFSWDKAQNATKYKYKIDANAEKTTTTTSVGYTCPSTATSVTITIAAGNSADQFSEEVSKTFTRLNKIETLTFSDDGELTWEAIDGADSYIISINGVEKAVTDTVYRDFEYGKTNTIKVKPTTSDGSTFADWSKSESRTYLAVPSNIKYDGQILSWKGASGASKYEVYINGNLEGETSSVNMQYDAGNTSFAASIKAIGDYSSTNRRVFDSKESDEVTFTFLDLITEFQVDDGYLSWEPVEEATGYQVKVGTQVYTQTDTKYKVAAGRTYDIQVKPIVDNGVFFSNYSDNQIINILEAPVIRWNNDFDLSDGQAKSNINWDLTTADIGGFNVKVVYKNVTGTDEVTVTPFDSTQKDFLYAFAKVGTYEVSVQTLANGEPTYYNSAYSNKINVTRLAAPTPIAGNGVTSNADNLNEGFKVTFNAVSGASEYQLYRDGVAVSNQHSTRPQFTVTNIVNDDNMVEQNYTYGVQSVGGVRNDSGSTYVTLSSLLADNYTFNINVQATPTNLSCDGYNANWDQVANATSYVVNFAGNETVNNNTYSLANIQPGVYELKVATKGNGSNVLPSTFTATQDIVRLLAPTNINVGTTQDEGLLKWDNVPNAASYQAYFGNSSEAVVADATTKVDAYVATTGLTISMVAVANYELNGTYYVTSPHSQSKQLIKLNTPTWPQNQPVVDNNLTWNAPANINTSVYSPTYHLFDKSGGMLAQIKTGTQYDTTVLSGGANYTFTVKAFGDGYNYLNSDISEPRSFYKIETPNVTRYDKGYQWGFCTNTQAYSVYIDGKLVESITEDNVTSLYKYPIDLAKFKSTNKEYKIQVVAQGDGIQNISSTACEFVQKTKTASAPIFTLGYSEAAYDINGEVQIDLTTPSDHVAGYVYSVGGAASTITTDVSYSYKTNAPGPFEVTVYGAGGVFDDDGVLYLDSDATKQTINILLAPSGGSITSRGILQWGAVTGRVKYELQIFWNDSTSTDVIEVTDTLYNISDKLGISFDIENFAYANVRAVGNGTTIITSAWYKIGKNN